MHILTPSPGACQGPSTLLWRSAPNLVPTPDTRRIAERMIYDAAATNGPDAVLTHLGNAPVDQIPALIGVLLTATKVHKKVGRPATPMLFPPEMRREGHRLYRRGDRAPWVVAAQREYQRANQRARRARGRVA